MKEPETRKSVSTRSLIDFEDPFEVRSVVLGGDIPNLESEIAFLNRQANGNGSCGKSGQCGKDDERPSGEAPCED